MRIRVARAAHRHPLLLDMLRDGRLHLSGIVRLLPVLTRDNRDALLARATFCSKRQILELVAELSPRPDVPTRMRKLPRQPHPPSHAATLASVALPLVACDRRYSGARAQGMAPAGRGQVRIRRRVASQSVRPSDCARTQSLCLQYRQVRRHFPMPRALVEPLSPGRYRVQFTASAELHAKLERLRALMGSQLPRATSPRSSTTPSARRSRAWRPAASRRRALLARGSRTRTPPRLRAMFRRRFGVPCSSGTGLAAATSTRRVGAAPSGTGSSSTTGIPSAWAETTSRTTSACCARHTTSSLARGDYGVLAMSRHGKPRSAPSPP